MHTEQSLHVGVDHSKVLFSHEPLTNPLLVRDHDDQGTCLAGDADHRHDVVQEDKLLRARYVTVDDTGVDDPVAVEKECGTHEAMVASICSKT